MRMAVVITAVALGLSGLSAVAENAGTARRGASGPDGKTRVPPHVRCDKDSDGVLSRDEWPFSAELFTKLDKNGDGGIDADERPGLRGKPGPGGNTYGSQGRGKGAPGAGGEGRGKGAPGAGGEGRGKGAPGAGGEGRGKGGPGPGGRGK